MLIVLAGEGPSDLGSCTNGLGICESDQFVPGPMTVLVDQIAEDALGYSLLEIPGSYRYISRGYLSSWAKGNAPRLRPTRGKCTPAEMSAYRIAACALAEIAKDISNSEDRPTIAVLFRDTDGTRSSEVTLWDDKRRAIYDGFRLARFDSDGVAMLPKPKSEAWLICAAKNDPYENCDRLEELSGNDESPKSAKKLLSELFANDSSVGNIIQWLLDKKFDCAKCAMPSFVAFREDLRTCLIRHAD